MEYSVENSKIIFKVSNRIFDGVFQIVFGVWDMESHFANMRGERRREC